MRKDQVVFLDTETTGLDPERHKIWEVAAIYWEDDQWKEYHTFVEHCIPGIRDFDVTLEHADPFALNIGKYWERYDKGNVRDWRTMIQDVVRITAGKHICGAIPSFDEERLRKYALRACLVPRWHYHIIDIEAMSIGFLAGLEYANLPKTDNIELPWRSDEIFELLGVVPTPKEEKHTALGDARQVKRVFERIVTWEKP